MEFNIESSRKIARIVFGLLFLLGCAYTYYLAINHMGQLAAKMSFITAILLTITVKPPPSPFATKNKEILLFYRNRLGFITIVFIPLSIFMIWVQMPYERIPHFKGIVTGYSVTQKNNSTTDFPVVEYYDDQKSKRTYVDNYASVLYPGRKFQKGEIVSVIVPNCSPGIQCVHIDSSFISRWAISFFLIGLHLIAAFGFLISEVRYRSFND